MPKPFFLLDVHDQPKAGGRDGELISQKDAWVGGDYLKNWFLVLGIGMEIGP